MKEKVRKVPYVLKENGVGFARKKIRKNEFGGKF